MKTYGKELIMDLHGCNPKAMTEPMIRRFMTKLCKAIDMEPVSFHVWVENNQQLPEHLIGVSACQFISTSNITMHALTKMKRVYINIFSCKDFDAEIASAFVWEYCGGWVTNAMVITRD